MAGIYIPNAKMPEECHYCPFRDSCEESAQLSHRPLYCPLVEVPDHGRLIDAGTVYAILSDFYNYNTYEQLLALLKALSKVPTIIPEDREVK